MSMTFEETRKYLLGKPESVLEYPFGPDTAVFKVNSRMFATLSENEAGAYSNLKCNPEEAIMLRDLFREVVPGYHMNKKHWNTVHLDGELPNGEIERMIDNSYTIVVKSLPRKTRQGMEIRHGSESLYR